MKNSVEVQCSASAEGVRLDTPPPRTLISLFGAGFHGWKLAAMVRPGLRKQGWDGQAQGPLLPPTYTHPCPCTEGRSGHLSLCPAKGFLQPIKMPPSPLPGAPATTRVPPLSLLFPVCIFILQMARLMGGGPSAALVPAPRTLPAFGSAADGSVPPLLTSSPKSLR